MNDLSISELAGRLNDPDDKYVDMELAQSLTAESLRSIAADVRSTAKAEARSLI